MAASTKLSNAVKALCYLTRVHPEPKNSSEISSNTGLNASKLRRLLSMLTKNGIVASTQGTSGGFILNKKPEDIHLQEIYCAIEDRKAFHLDVNTDDTAPGVDMLGYNNYFNDLFSEIQVEIENKLRNITIKDILEKIFN
ncbi:MAG: Rrf2 family transcriptional regulator [Melioribacteraceae bacterium]|nr:Rrf2 family transcriptional regulator [Melioribacteraceae bacterium]